VGEDDSVFHRGDLPPAPGVRNPRSRARERVWLRGTRRRKRS
jgi:hypothetical protein